MAIWVYVLCNFSQKIDIGSNLEIQCIYYWPKQQHDLPISKKNPDFGWQILLSFSRDFESYPSSCKILMEVGVMVFKVIGKEL